MSDAFAVPAPRKLPRQWTARARQAAELLEPPVLLRRLPTEPVQYLAIKRRTMEWRIAIADRSLCAVGDCDVTGHGNLVFDHCHDHGWLRGLICGTHNVRLGQIDAVRRIPGVRLDLSATPYAALLAACPDCVN